MKKLSSPSYNDAIPYYIFVDFYKQNILAYDAFFPLNHCLHWSLRCFSMKILILSSVDHYWLPGTDLFSSLWTKGKHWWLPTERWKVKDQFTTAPRFHFSFHKKRFNRIMEGERSSDNSAKISYFLPQTNFANQITSLNLKTNFKQITSHCVAGAVSTHHHL